MPKQIIQDNIWQSRLTASERYFNQWDHLFKCRILEQYYEGFQWKSQTEMGYEPYTINKVYETLQIKIAEFCPTFLKYNVTPRPGNMNYDKESAMNSAILKEDTLNSIISDDKEVFSQEVEMAYKDSFFRFGILEVGYAADWILNPNAPKPLTQGSTDTQANNKHRIIGEPPELPINERIYVKHVNAGRFRVGGIDHKYLSRCGWCGYYDYIYKDDLLSISNLMNKDKIESAKGTTVDPESETGDKKSDIRFKGTALKIWKIWDLRANVQLLILDSPKVTIFQRKFKRLSLFDLRHDRRLSEGFYPVPPVFHWLSPQNEINETREMLRAHRRRFLRKFQVIEGTIDDDEIEKFETGPDGALVKVKRENAITPIENADLGNSLNESMVTASDDLNRISFTSSEMRGVADRTTATQAQLVNQRSSIVEAKQRDQVALWLSRVGREILLTARDKFTMGIWTKLSSPEGEDFLGSVNDDAEAYKWVTSEDLNDDFDFRIDVDVTTLSVNAAEEEKKHFMEFLSVLTQFPMIAFSPTLVREAAYRVGYRNTKAIKEFQKMALLMELGRMNQLQAAAMPPGSAPQQINQSNTPPGGEQVRQQMQQTIPAAAQVQ